MTTFAEAMDLQLEKLAEVHKLLYAACCQGRTKEVHKLLRRCPQNVVHVLLCK